MSGGCDVEGWNRSSVRAVARLSPRPLEYEDEEETSRRSVFGTMLVEVSCEGPSWDEVVPDAQEFYDVIEKLGCPPGVRSGVLRWEHWVEAYPVGDYLLEVSRTWFVEPGELDPSSGKKRAKRALVQRRQELWEAGLDGDADVEEGYSGVRLSPLSPAQRFLLRTGELGAGVSGEQTRQVLIPAAGISVPGLSFWRPPASLWDEEGVWPVVRPPHEGSGVAAGRRHRR